MASGDVVVVDSRDMGVYNDGYIPGAKNITSPSIQPALLESVKVQLGMLPKDKLLVFYGDQDGEAEAVALAQTLIGLNAGYDTNNIKVLEGGFNQWLNLGYPSDVVSQCA